MSSPEKPIPVSSPSPSPDRDPNRDPIPNRNPAPAPAPVPVPVPAPPPQEVPAYTGAGCFLFVLGLLAGSIAVGAAAHFGLPGLGALSGSTSAAGSDPTAVKQRYHCPMHPTYTSDTMGNCPICGMKLVPIPASHTAHADGEHPADPAAAASATDAAPVASGGGAGDPASEEEAEPWQCPVHPTYTAEEPGECLIDGEKLVPVPGTRVALEADAHRIVGYRSPHDPTQTSPVPLKDDMGMDYVPIYASEITPSVQVPVKGLVEVTIDPERQQLIGVRTALVREGPVGRVWRTTGRVLIDETRVRKVNVKTDGFVEDLHVDYVGMPVKKGDALLELYSPELVSAQTEYLLAVRTDKLLARGAAPGVDGAETPRLRSGLTEVAREKLRLWDVSSWAIARLERTGQVQKTLTLTSPIAGIVTQKSVVQGSKLSAGDTPFEITDLSHVWVNADVYASEIGLMRLGMKATLTLQGQAGRVWNGEVDFIDPLVNEKTRTVKVRLSFDNQDGELRPGSFGDMVFHGDERKGLLIATDAVIDSGTQKVVFLVRDGGRFEPRKVQTAPAPGDDVEVTAGLQVGDRVVVRANFLIDSESRLKAALAAMAEGQK